MLKVRVLVVDDSLTIRAMLEEVFAHDPDLNVIGIASNADQAHELIVAFHPDVMTLDIEMPGMNGIQFLTEVMHDTPLPVVMISSQTPREAPLRAEALRRGAVACLNKANIMDDAELLCRIIKKAGHQVVHRID